MAEKVVIYDPLNRPIPSKDTNYATDQHTLKWMIEEELVP